MANERTLLERMMNPEARSGRSARDRRQNLADSVVSHLTRLLNSRQGCCLTALDYGMPDMNDSEGAANEIKVEMENVIRSTIQRYEPRLRHVQVHYDDQEEVHIQPRFRITAQLAMSDDGPREVTFSTIVDHTGKMSIW